MNTKASSVFRSEFGLGDVARAAAVSENTIQNWIRRGYIVGFRGDGDGPRPRRKFSFYNVIEIATAARLIDAGVPIADAFHAASDFAHGGANGRHPGAPYPGGNETLIGVRGSESHVMEMQRHENPLPMLRHWLGDAPAFSILYATATFNETVLRLGFIPKAVMAAAYEND